MNNEYKPILICTGDFTNALHYDGGARLTEYMNRVRIQRVLSSQILQLL